MQKILAKKDFNNFVDNLIKNFEVIAPVKSDPSEFKKISSSNEIDLEKITLIPAKKFFLPENEIIFEYKNKKLITNEGKINQRIILGLRKCDLNSLLVLDNVMKDMLYINKRKNTILIGFFCSKPDEFCFCNSMELVDYYDLFFYPYKKNYIISVGSKKGEELVKNLISLKKEIKIPDPNNFKKLLNKDIEKNYRNKIWETDAEKCLSCTACTDYCPTCNCFDIKDHIDIVTNDGIRTRSHMSCMLKNFSKVAGGKAYREARLARYKHFVYHKIVYYKKHFNKYMCTGCGRCIRVCPTKIDWVKTINLLKDMEKIKFSTRIKNSFKNSFKKIKRLNVEVKK